MSSPQAAAAGPSLVIIEFPSNLGLRPSGVERLPDALRGAGLHEQIGIARAERVDGLPAYDPARPADTRVLNDRALQESSVQVAERVTAVVGSGELPLVLAGDCSVILGGLLGLRWARRAESRTDRVGLLFVDGHVDFYQPEASPTGEAADMDLALATGRGPQLLTNFDGVSPLVRDEDVIAVGARDASERDRAGAQDIRGTAVRLYELDAVRALGIETVAADALGSLGRSDLDGFWLHLDADVLDDDVMPAVDYRQPGGLSPTELTILLRRAIDSGALAGMSVAIYNPALDPNGRAARVLVSCLVQGLARPT